jgi:hypothetical protein
MTNTILQLLALSFVWFLSMATVGGPLGFYFIIWLKSIRVAESLLLILSVAYFLGALAAYYGVLYFKIVRAPPYDGLSLLVAFLVWTAPLLLAVAVGGWMLSQLRFGW